MNPHNLLREKLNESVNSVLPIALIVAFLCLLFIPINSGLFLSFLIGTMLIIVGMALFGIGSDLSMIQIGNHVGAKITKSKNIAFILITALILGIAITVAEPDLQVLAKNAPNIDTGLLIATVSVGVGIFLVICMLRILLGIPLKWLLLIFYGVIFVLAGISDKQFLSVAFDSGGVTTGPMTVPFIMALGVGVASIRSDKRAGSDSFGLVALCSIGPILTVLILGLIYPSNSATAQSIINSFEHTVEIGREYFYELPHFLSEVLIALLPIMLIFLIFNALWLRLKKRPFLHITVGLLYTFAGLVLFLLGVNVGFSSLGNELGSIIAQSGFKWLLVPLSMLMGWFIIKAEPAVHILTQQVYEHSAGAITQKSMNLTLSIAISAAMGLAMLRVLTGINILWFMLPGYFIALILSFVVPPTFTAIAFDAGGVASGPMTATFMLPFAIGASTAIGGNIMTDAFGLVAMVAMMPLITIQVMGALTMSKSRSKSTDISSPFADGEIIELWEVQ